jgi:hypothetical protein
MGLANVLKNLNTKSSLAQKKKGILTLITSVPIFTVAIESGVGLEA